METKPLNAPDIYNDTPNNLSEPNDTTPDNIIDEAADIIADITSNIITDDNIIIDTDRYQLMNEILSHNEIINQNKIINPNKIYQYIYHISDIHIESNIIILDNLVKAFCDFIIDLKKAKNIDASLVVITGDVFDKHCTYTSAYDISIFNNIIRIITNLGYDIIIIAGNHDIYLNDKKDSIGPLLYDKKNNKVHYYKHSGVYRHGNINFVVISLIDNFKIPEIPTEKNIYNIALMHATIEGIVFQNGYISKKSINLPSIDILNKFDAVLLGDLHEQRFINYKIAYAGSLTQNNTSESLSKGYVLWDLSRINKENIQINEMLLNAKNINLSQKQIDEYKSKVKNLGDFNNVDIQHIIFRIYVRNNIIQDYAEKLKKYDKIHKLIIDFDNNTSRDVINELKETINSYTNIQIDSIHEVTSYKPSIIDTSQLNDINAQNKHLKDILKTQPEATVNQIIELHKDEHNKKIINGNYIAPNQWSLIYMMWENIYCFGQNNIIDFTKLPDQTLTGIIADNNKGKSSFLNILLYGLFNKASTTIKRIRRLNMVNGDQSYINIRIKINNDFYNIIKIIKIDGAPSLLFKNNIYEAPSEILNTIDTIKSLIGSYETFRTAHIYANNNPIDNLQLLTPAELKVRFNSIFKIDIIEDIAKDVDLRIKKLDVMHTEYKSKLSKAKKLNKDILTNKEIYEKENTEYNSLINSRDVLENDKLQNFQYIELLNKNKKAIIDLNNELLETKIESYPKDIIIIDDINIMNIYNIDELNQLLNQNNLINIDVLSLINKYKNINNKIISSLNKYYNIYKNIKQSDIIIFEQINIDDEYDELKIQIDDIKSKIKNIIFPENINSENILSEINKLENDISELKNKISFDNISDEKLPSDSEVNSWRNKYGPDSPPEISLSQLNIDFNNLEQEKSQLLKIKDKYTDDINQLKNKLYKIIELKQKENIIQLRDDISKIVIDGEYDETIKYSEKEILSKLNNIEAPDESREKLIEQINEFAKYDINDLKNNINLNKIKLEEYRKKLYNIKLYDIENINIQINDIDEKIKLINIDNINSEIEKCSNHIIIEQSKINKMKFAPRCKSCEHNKNICVSDNNYTLLIEQRDNFNKLSNEARSLIDNKNKYINENEKLNMQIKNYETIIDELSKKIADNEILLLNYSDNNKILLNKKLKEIDLYEQNIKFVEIKKKYDNNKNIIEVAKLEKAIKELSDQIEQINSNNLITDEINNIDNKIFDTNNKINNIQEKINIISEYISSWTEYENGKIYREKLTKYTNMKNIELYNMKNKELNVLKTIQLHIINNAQYNTELKVLEEKINNIKIINESKTYLNKKYQKIINLNNINKNILIKHRIKEIKYANKIADLERLKENDKEYNLKINIYNDAVTSLNTIYNKLKINKAEQLKIILDINEKELIEINNYLDENKKLYDEHELLTIYLPCLTLKNGIASRLFKDNMNKLNDYMRKLYAKFMNVNINITHIIKENTTSIMIQIDDILLSDCCSSQQFMFNILFKLSINKCVLMNTSEFLFIDEGFGTLDNFNRIKIGNELKNLSSEFTYIFIVSHIDEIKNMLYNPLSIENANKISHMSNVANIDPYIQDMIATLTNIQENNESIFIFNKLMSYRLNKNDELCMICNTIAQNKDRHNESEMHINNYNKLINNTKSSVVTDKIASSNKKPPNKTQKDKKQKASSDNSSRDKTGKEEVEATVDPASQPITSQKYICYCPINSGKKQLLLNSKIKHDANPRHIAYKKDHPDCDKQ